MHQLLQLLLALAAVRAANAFVYSCEEVKYRIVNNNLREFNTSYACLVLEEGYNDFDQLRKLSVVSGSKIHYFDDIAKEPTRCVSINTVGTPFHVNAASGAASIDCTKEFTLIFSSGDFDTHDAPAIFPVSKLWSKAEWRDGMVHIVAPQTGIVIKNLGCASKTDGTFTVMTGVGLASGEEMNYLANWNCHNSPDWIVSFDSVITISNDYLTTTEVEFSTDLTYNNPRSGELIVVFTNGMSNDLQNRKGGIEHRASFKFDNSAHDLVTANLQLTFDTSNYGSIVLKESAQGSDKQFFNGTYTEKFNTDYFEVGYIPTGLQPVEIGKSQDNIRIDINIGNDVPAPSAAPPHEDHDPYCNCAVDKNGFAAGWKTTEIWLDIAIVLDTSEAMNPSRLNEATRLVESLISADKSDFLITDPTASFYTRIGVISMAETAQVLYNLNMTKDDKVQASIKKGLANININDAFKAAQDMLNNGVKSQPDRANTRQVIYFITDSDASRILEEPFRTFRNSGIIIVNNPIKEGEPIREGLKKIASNGYYYSSNSNLHELQTFCKANCFCGANTITYAEAEPMDKAEGGCYRFELTAATFANARKTCEDRGAILPTVHDDQKGQFMLYLNNTGVPFSDYYWIGYEKYTTGEFQWVDGSTDPYTNWAIAAGEPSSNPVSKCTYVDRVMYKSQWGAGNCNIKYPFACQYTPCSVGSKTC